MKKLSKAKSLRANLFRKTFRKNKILLFLMLFLTSQLYAEVSYSQIKKLTIDIENVEARKVLDEIENQSEFHFIYNERFVDMGFKTSVRCANENIFNVLDQLFAGRDITYRVIDKQIVLSQKEKIVVQDEQTITGTVTDQNGDPIPGVTVRVKGTSSGTITNMDGEFTIDVPEDGEVLVFSFIGMKTLEQPLDGSSSYSITMEADAVSLEEVVVVGYGTQSKATLTGSVASVNSDEIVTTKNENIQNMLAGKISGVRVDQKSAEPGQFNASFDIRGFGDPLIVVDGVPRETFTRINPEDIKNMSVLKDASAAVYGVRAANGVILIETKKGGKEDVSLNYSTNYTWQMPRGDPETTSAVDWMTLANENSLHSPDAGRLRFDQSEIDAYRNGTKQGTDWHDQILASGAPQTKHTLSAQGGSDLLNFYTSFGYQSQQSFFKSPALDYDRFNVRANINSQLTDRLELNLNLNGITEENGQAFYSTEDIIGTYQRSNPTIPVYANNTEPYFQKGRVIAENAVAMMDPDVSGDRSYGQKWFESSLSLTYDVPYVEGLEAKAMFSYDYNMSDNDFYRRAYNVFEYNDANNSYIPSTQQSPMRVRREFYSNTSTLYNLSLNYDRSFSGNHNVEALILLEGSRREGDNFYAQRDLTLDLPRLFAGRSEDQQGSMYDDAGALYRDANTGLIGRVNYDYKSKYLTEFSFRYDGSSRFAKEYQWGFFPSASIGWRISEEPFWDALGLSFIHNAKIRGSYGILGDDAASSYQFVTGYEYPAPGNMTELSSGSLFNGNWVNSSATTGIPNPKITWYTSQTLNIGVDIDAWKNLLGISFDFFERNRDDLLGTRAQSLPQVVGASLPQENLNSDLTRGFDLEVRHRNRINDFRYNIKGLFSVTRNKNRYVERSESGNSYQNWRNNPNNRWQGIWWGYDADGRYTTYDEIANSNIYVDRGILPGDYKYGDWNEDGMIDDKDVHPISYSGDPLINFGVTFAGQYKGFDINLLFQGASMNYVAYRYALLQPMWGDMNSNALEMFMDRWHPKDPLADPYDPNTEWNKGYYAYTGTVPRRDSYHAIYDGNYVRLKSAEIGYTLPESVTKTAGIQEFRFYFNGYNLLTFTKMKYLDPEKPSDSGGNLYPLSMSVTVGIDVKF